jgi:OFA family oxalate/formate antiporter-like MFS transporter
MAACFITTTIGGIFLLGTFKTFGQEIFDSEGFLSMLSSTAALFAAAGRVFWGTLSDRMGVLNSLFVLTSILSVIILTYPLASNFGQLGFAVWTYSLFFFTGGNFSLYMPLNMQIFGSKHAGPNYGIFFAMYSFSTYINIAFLADENVSFLWATRSMGLLTLFGFCNLLVFRFHLNKVRAAAAAPLITTTH